MPLESQTQLAGNADRPNGPISPTEVHSLLEFAHQCQLQVWEARRGLLRLGSGLIVSVAVAAASFAHLITLDSLSQQLRVLLAVLVGTAVCIVLPMVGFAIRSLRRELIRGNRSILEVVRLMREIEPEVAASWSELDRAQFRIRLSQFDIGPPLFSSLVR